MSFVVTKQRLLIDLYKAYEDASRHKSKKEYVVRFRENLDVNLGGLCDEIMERRWIPSPSFCFIINEPKKREVFAANFRDRIVHHLYYNYTHEMFEKTFIADSYSCIKGRGTHYGIHRLESHIRKESRNYSRECYVLKMDIKGYFMHIDRRKLLGIVLSAFEKMRSRFIGDGKKYDDVLDFDMLSYLSESIIMSDPTKGCVFRSKPSDWDDLPSSKTLFGLEEGVGLPIGNLTSQLFSNVFLNVLDQFAKRKLKCRHYGRYVDDFYVVSCDRKFLHSLIPCVEGFLSNVLGLNISEGKTQIYDTRVGVPFLGAFVKHYRTYIENRTFSRIREHMSLIVRKGDGRCMCNSINSYLGTLSHWRSYGVRYRLLYASVAPCFVGKVSLWCEKFSYV